MHLKDASLLLQVRAYIDSNLHRNLPISQLCREFNTNKTSLQERFRAYCGTSLHAFLLQCRMEKALVLLRETDDPVKFVAMQCGYRRVHSFNKAFKAYAQSSPGAYRRRHLLFSAGLRAVESDINPVKSYIA
ncbi:MAG TPA: AraC family transcriptional regulator [Puia sp.]|nr:AraC family transcriptional regulator [Puia sp.]